MNRISGFSIGILVGVVLSVISPYTLGYTAAIAMPSSMAKGGLAALYLWEIVVVQFLGAGIWALLLTYFTIRFLPGNRTWKLFGIVAGALALMYGYYAPELLHSLEPLQHLYALVIAACVLTVAFVISDRASEKLNAKHL